MHLLERTLAATLLLGLFACAPGPPPEERVEDDVEPGVTSYRAELEALNSSVTEAVPMGTAILTLEGDTMTIEVEAENLPAGMMHLQHYHGFVDGTQAECPTAEADTNADGITDLIETEAVSGITLVPFHDDPASLTLIAETYPEADEEGRYTYSQTVDLAALRQALQDEHGIEELGLDERVVYIHGVPEGTELPDTVQSLPDVPAHVTLPIACGLLELVETEETTAL